MGGKDIIRLDEDAIAALREASRRSPRRRAHHTVHDVLDDPVQRVAIALQPGTYRPTTDKDFAVWAPPEGDMAAPALVRWMEGALPGDAPQQ